MSQYFLNLIRQGNTAEITAEVEANRALARYRDAQGVSALMLSVYTGQPAIRDFLRTHAGDLDIFEAASLGDCERLGHLIAEDATRVRAVSGDGWPPLHLSAAFAGPDTVLCLLEHGAHVHQFSHNPQRNQALHACIALGNSLDAVRLLVDAGADVNARQAGGYTPLLQAAAAGKKDLVLFLLERGADKTVCCDQGKTAADYARERGHSALAGLV